MAHMHAAFSSSSFFLSLFLSTALESSRVESASSACLNVERVMRSRRNSSYFIARPYLALPAGSFSDRGRIRPPRCSRPRCHRRSRVGIGCLFHASLFYGPEARRDSPVHSWVCLRNGGRISAFTRRTAAIIVSAHCVFLRIVLTSLLLRLLRCPLRTSDPAVYPA